jgi:hypothetical protein
MEDEDFKVPCTVRYEWITPEAAKQMLDTGNRRNRKVSGPPVKRMQGIIKRGEWMYDSTDAIGLASDGAVVNGQHRLTAIAEGDIGVWVLVARNVRPEIIKVIDQPTIRTLTQALEIDGRFPEPGVLAAAVKEIYAKMLHDFKKTVPGEYKPTIPQELELLAQHPHLQDSLGMGGRVHRKLNCMTKPLWVAYHYAFSCVDAERADEFYAALATGEDINDGDPAYLLRERLIAEPAKDVSNKRTLEHWEAVYLLITAWEANKRDGLSAKDTRLLHSGFPVAAAHLPHVTSVPWLVEAGTLL